MGPKSLRCSHIDYPPDARKLSCSTLWLVSRETNGAEIREISVTRARIEASQMIDKKD